MSETPVTTFSDVELLCKDCGKPFIFTAKEQQFFVKQGFEHVPTRCANCRTLLREKREAGRQFVSLRCKMTGKIGRLPIETDDPNDAYTAEAFEDVYAQQGREVDPAQEPDYTELIEERRAAQEAERTSEADLDTKNPA
jgi:RNase P subunit RPR2